MRQVVRGLFVSAGIGCAVLGVGYFAQQPWALATWPWTDGRLSNIFVASMLAALALPLAWIGCSAQFRAAAGGFAHLAVILGGSASVFFGAGIAQAPARWPAYGAGALAAALACAALVHWSLRQPVADTRLLPRSARAWFVAYIAVLVPAGGALLSGVPGIMPWPLKAETSALYGWIFLAAVCSFAYPLWRPRVENAVVGLLGFLAYDLALIPPFVAHFERVRPEFTTTLVSYTTVLVMTALVSVWYLFVSPHTRLQSADGHLAGR